ncbi:MAG: hypothetical protein EOO60_06800, partial [Hymenobacter sp.]
FTPKYGARPITGVIRSQLRRPISRLIIGGEARPGTVLSISKPAGEGELLWTTTHETPAPEATLAPAGPLEADA